MPTDIRPPEALDSFATMPGHLIRRVYQAATALFADECGAQEVTPVQYAALVAARSHPGIDATRLSRAVHVDRSTIGDVLDRLEARGWIVRTASPHDRRMKRVTLAPRGRDVLRRVEPGVRRVQARLLAALAPGDRDTLVRLLTRLAEAHDHVHAPYD